MELLDAGFDVVVIDNLYNSKREVLTRVEQITGKKIKSFHEIDLKDEAEVEKVFNQYSSHQIYAVIHFAGLKAVGESTQMPIEYYENNIGGSKGVAL